MARWRFWNTGLRYFSFKLITWCVSVCQWLPKTIWFKHDWITNCLWLCSCFLGDWLRYCCHHVTLNCVSALAHDSLWIWTCPGMPWVSLIILFFGRIEIHLIVTSPVYLCVKKRYCPEVNTSEYYPKEISSDSHSNIVCLFGWEARHVKM